MTAAFASVVFFPDIALRGSTVTSHRERDPTTRRRDAAGPDRPALARGRARRPRRAPRRPPAPRAQGRPVGAVADPQLSRARRPVAPRWPGSPTTRPATSPRSPRCCNCAAPSRRRTDYGDDYAAALRALIRRDEPARLLDRPARVRGHRGTQRGAARLARRRARRRWPRGRCMHRSPRPRSAIATSSSPSPATPRRRRGARARSSLPGTRPS